MQLHPSRITLIMYNTISLMQANDTELWGTNSPSRFYFSTTARMLLVLQNQRYENLGIRKDLLERSFHKCVVNNH